MKWKCKRILGGNKMSIKKKMLIVLGIFVLILLVANTIKVKDYTENGMSIGGDSGSSKYTIFDVTDLNKVSDCKINYEISCDNGDCSYSFYKNGEKIEEGYISKGETKKHEIIIGDVISHEVEIVMEYTCQKEHSRGECKAKIEYKISLLEYFIRHVIW